MNINKNSHYIIVTCEGTGSAITGLGDWLKSQGFKDTIGPDSQALPKGTWIALPDGGSEGATKLIRSVAQQLSEHPVTHVLISQSPGNWIVWH